VTLVLVRGDGEVLGALPPIELPRPHWPESADLVAAARERHGVEVTVLRLLSSERPHPPGGAITMLAEVADAPALAPVSLDLSPHPLRLPYAEVGGPRASLAWAAAALGAPLTEAVQQRTWNLSTIWRLSTGDRAVWLKQVPPFFAHEAAVLTWIAGQGFADLVPAVVAHADGRALLEDLPGPDHYHAGPSVRRPVAAALHELQRHATGRVAELFRLGVPDGRFPLLRVAIERVVAEHGAGIDGLAALVAGLPARLAEVAACGLPDTLVHGDPHPGNVRGPLDRLVLLDWGDSRVGHPAFDILTLADGDTDLIAEWAGRWRRDVPGCAPERAVELLRPVAALRGAVVYADFVAGIEPSEHPYHADDVPAELRRAVAEAAVTSR
jgi:hypothetical protein